MSKYIVQATWEDVPHLSAEEKADLLKEIPPYQRDARSKGVPQLGSGAIYPVGETDIIVPDFPIPDYFPRAYGLDVGWNVTAAIWGARNPEDGITYLYSAYKRSHAEPSIHVDAIKARGGWIPGVVDPAARGRSQKDGTQLITIYGKTGLGLDLEPAQNAVESGLYLVWQLLSAGRLKVFSTLAGWLDEFRLYRRDEQGRVVKDNDHLMDACRYLMVSGMERAIVKPVRPLQKNLAFSYSMPALGWMG